MTGQKSQVKFHFNVGSVDSFERKLDEAQEDLGWRPDMYVPVTYVTEMSVLNEVFKLAPTILLIGAYIWFTRRSMGGISGTGGLGGGGKGIFSVGKAQVNPPSFTLNALLWSLPLPGTKTKLSLLVTNFWLDCFKCCIEFMRE